MPPGKSSGSDRQNTLPSRTSRTPLSTCSWVSRLMRPSWSSGPKSPQFEPSGRWFQRFMFVSIIDFVGVSGCTDGDATAYIVSLSGHEAAAFVHEIGNGVSHVLGLADTANRYACQQLARRFALGVVRGVEKFRADGSWRDGVHRDAVARQFQCPRARHADHARLGGAVERAFTLAQRCAGTNVHDPATTPFAHARQQRLRAE